MEATTHEGTIPQRNIHKNETTRRGHHTEGTPHGGDTTRRGYYTDYTPHGGDTTWRGHHMEGTPHGGDIMQRGYTSTGGIYIGGDIHTERTYIWRRHTHGGCIEEIHMERTYRWRGHIHKGNTAGHTRRGTYTRRNIHTEQIYTLYRLCRCSALFDGLST